MTTNNHPAHGPVSLERLSLNDAIAHADERADALSGLCAAQHAQLAAWLRELQERRKADKGEPIYQWRERYEEGSLWDDCTKAQYDGFAKKTDCEVRILYTAPPAPVVPDDWVMVPKEPTRQMMAQGHFAMKGTDRGKFRRIYQAMITAASALNKGEY
ncbi:hypothetical protein E0X61_06490 [Salmonella enterica subsp. enterica serovar Potsdam]|nr:hypothetical protein [Salmonella enterica subsp. enterica serovar Potsdam]HDP0192493.1 hypothetical protein [Salmonella enterica subsp. enterica serovar Concord]HDP0196929.1 hypothetical protein [Salmonella enterica subsp. enterica serovar Concord]HDP0374098.1 hypothetical protein [Salmonella enterica subsp. enterica serovar Concord]